MNKHSDFYKNKFNKWSRNLTVIEDKGFLSQDGMLNTYNLFVGPMDIQDAEEYEARFERKKIPYTLTYGYVADKDSKKTKGYYLFLECPKLSTESRVHGGIEGEDDSE